MQDSRQKILTARLAHAVSTPIVDIRELRTPRRLAHSPLPLLPNLPTVEMVTKSGPTTTFEFTNSLYSGEAGKAYVPATLPSQNRGLILLCHGGFGLQSDPIPPDTANDAYRFLFEYLGRLLASNGFVVVSIRHIRGTGGQSARMNFLRNLEYIYKDPEKKFASFSLKDRPVGLMGHSESASGALRAALDIESGSSEASKLSGLISSVAAVVCFAPTKNATVPNTLASPVLILQGTHDGDTPAGGLSMRVYEQIDTPAKFFLWLHGANHGNFLQGDLAPDLRLVGISESDKAKAISGETQRFVTQNYVAMFYLWNLSGVAKYESVFVSDKTVAWIPPSKIIQEDLDLRFRALPLYQSASAASLGAFPSNLTLTDFLQDGLSPIGPKNPVTFKPLSELNLTLEPHLIPGIVLEWVRGLRPSPSILVQCDKDVMASLPKALEFQAVLLGGTTLNMSSNNPVQIEARLISGGTKSSPVTIIVERSVTLNAKIINTPFSATRSVLSTVRIPVSKFGGVTDSFLKNANLLLDFSKSTPLGKIALTGFRASFK